MDPACKHVQLKLLLSQFDEETRKHIAQCETCWETFMNIGPHEPTDGTASQQKHAFLNQAAEPEYKGDLRMKQFQLLSSLPLTAYAKQLFLDYFTKLEQGKSQSQRDWRVVLAALEDAVYSKLQKKKREQLDPESPIDAEVMMGVLDELGAPETFLASTQPTATGAVSAPIKRLYRSDQERMVFGICGGIAEYFRVDPILVRILFVGATFLGGWSIPVYLLLLFLMPHRPEHRPVFTESQPAIQPPAAPQPDTPSQPKRKPWVVRFARGLFGFGVAVFLFGAFYIPLLAVFGAISVGSAYAVFAPIYTHSHVSQGHSFVHQLSLADFGLPGIVGGASISILFFALFMVVLGFVFRLHFRKDLLGKNIQSIFIAFIVMSLFSGLVSAGLVINEFKESTEVTKTKHFALAPKQRVFRLSRKDLLPIESAGIRIESVSITSDPKAKDIRTQFTLTARGKTTFHAQQQLQHVSLQWPTTKGKQLPVPRLTKRKNSFLFLSARIAITLPQGLALELKKTRTKLRIKGTFTDTMIIQNSRKKLVLKDVSVPRIHLDNSRGNVSLHNVTTRHFQFQNSRGNVSMYDVKTTTLDLTNSRGRIKGNNIEGSFSINNTRGRVNIKGRKLTFGPNALKSTRGRVQLWFPPREVPKVTIKEQSRSRIDQSEIDLYAPAQATLQVHSHRSRIRFSIWKPETTSASQKNLQPTNTQPATNKGAAPKATPQTTQTNRTQPTSRPTK